MNGQVEVDRGRMVRELIGRPNVCSRSVVVRRTCVCRKLESAKMRMGRRLLVPSNTLAGVVVQGDGGWRKLEERREKMKNVW